MFLAIDIGNTNITLGLWQADHWMALWRAQTIRERMADEYAVLLRGFFAEHDLRLADIQQVAIGSVVPPLTSTFEELCERYIGGKPLIIGPGVRTGVRIRAESPNEVGPDRVINTAAAHRLYGGPAIVVDLGTATTFDVVSAEGDYLGGAIAPGLSIAADALVQRTARLPRVELVPPPTAIGRNTIQAMQSGLLLGYIGLIEGLVTRIRTELGGQAHIIATGGLADLIARHTPVIEIVAPYLTLDGLRFIYELNFPG